MRKLTILAIFSALLAAAGCKKKDPLYCDFDTPCTEVLGRDFCDIKGEFPDSMNVKHTCIPNPFRDGGIADGGPSDDAAVPGDGALLSDGGDAAPAIDAAQPDARPIDAGQCSTTAMCSGAFPLCNTATALCRACSTAAECLAKNAATPYCDTSGACVACRTMDDCAANLQACDATSKTCRLCRADNECTSGICNESSGSCEGESLILYVGPTGIDGAGCGTRTAKCRTIAMALTQLGSKRRMHLETATYPEAFALTTAGLLIVGNGSVISPSVAFSDRPAVSLSQGADVTIEKLAITSGRGANGDGIRCSGGAAGASLLLLDVTLQANDANGIQTSNCTLTMLDGASLDHARGAGILANSSNVVVKRAALSANGYAGVWVNASTLAMERTLLSGNVGEGLYIKNSSFSVRNNMVLRNGYDPRDSTAGGEGGVVIDGPAPTQAVFAFNTVAGNEFGQSSTRAASGIHCINQTTSVSLSHNIVYGNAAPQFAGNCVFFYSDVQGGASGATNINADPMFVNEFHISALSPCRDRGVNAGAPSDDYDGQPRPASSGTNVDIGADEVP